MVCHKVLSSTAAAVAVAVAAAGEQSASLFVTFAIFMLGFSLTA